MIATILIAFILFVVLLVGYWLTYIYRTFVRARLFALSAVSDIDVVGGIGISLLSPSPININTVVGLLDSRYPQSEVIVMLDSTKRPNMLEQLKIRYMLSQTLADNVVYRSRRYIYSRLLVVDVAGINDLRQQLDIAAKYASFDYLFVIPSSSRLLPYAVGRVAEAIASQNMSKVDRIEVGEDGVEIVSRVELRKSGGFASKSGYLKRSRSICIAEPLIVEKVAENSHCLLIERSRYNFWDFLAFKIMKYKNKLLSLKK